MTASPLAYVDSQVKPGWIAFFLVLLLVVATFLLWRSMNTQLGKIRVPPRASFERGGSESEEPTEHPDGDPPPPSTGPSETS